jgi:hypothetical protein
VILSQGGIDYRFQEIASGSRDGSMIGRKCSVERPRIDFGGRIVSRLVPPSWTVVASTLKCPKRAIR